MTDREGVSEFSAALKMLVLTTATLTLFLVTSHACVVLQHCFKFSLAEHILSAKEQAALPGPGHHGDYAA
jgi:hypothetical protein